MDGKYNQAAMGDLDAVQRAMLLAEQMQFTHSCTAETGRLLRLLASQFSSGTIAEIGTGCGIGAAWIAEGLQPSTRLLTVEIDEERSSAAARLFEDSASVEVLRGDWHRLAEFAPFVMLFADGGEAKQSSAEELIKLMQPGGLIVLDDLTPVELWPDECRGKSDPVRDIWLNHPHLIATEIRVKPDAAVILATKRHRKSMEAPSGLAPIPL